MTAGRVASAVAVALALSGVALATDSPDPTGDLSQIATGGAVVGALVALRGLRLRLVGPFGWTLELGPPAGRGGAAGGQGEGGTAE